MKPNELLNHLSKIEDGLHSFSFEELNAHDATELKRTFESFKKNLEQKVFGAPNEETVIVVDQKQTNKTAEASEHSLIANVSHEIRTPLNGIIGFIDLLRETKLNKKQLELVDALSTSSNNLMNIINELLEFSKLSARKERFESVEFNLKNLLHELSYLCQTLIVDKNIEFNLSIDKDIPDYIIGDPSKLSQVLLNLLGNAIKFVEKGEINLIVHLKSRKDDALKLGFKIVDTGIGIAGDKLEKIFSSYQQADTDTHLKYGGTGLGLTIVKEIIEQLNGKISVSSTLGVGTTFRLEIPYLRASQKVKTVKIKETVHKKDSNLLAGTTVLVFEDNELNQKLITNRLNNWGCKTIVTDNGTYGLELIHNQKIDLILMDLRMPGMTGFDITKQIRNSTNKAINTIPIIALSADFTSTDKEQFNTLRINDFILKPFKPNELFEKIKKNINETISDLDDTIEIHANSNIDGEARLVNFEPVLEDCMGKVDLLEELIQLFTTNILEFTGKTKESLLEYDFEGILFAVHKIKNSLSMLRLKSLLEIVEQMSREAGSNKDIKHLSFLYEMFLYEYANVAPKIEKEITRIKLKTKN